MIAFDTSILSLALCPDVDVAVDPRTKKTIERPKERIDLLISELDARGEQILIPTPVLAEFLVLTGNASARYLETIHKLPRFVIREFTERAAIEVSQAIRKALDSMRPALTAEENAAKKRDDVEATWAKVNFDRQIVAIAKVEPCSAIYSTDGDVAKHAEKMKLTCVHLADLPLPPDPPREPQLDLFAETITGGQSQAGSAESAEGNTIASPSPTPSSTIAEPEQSASGGQEQKLGQQASPPSVEPSIAEPKVEPTASDKPAGSGDGSNSLVDATGVGFPPD
jgi:predicted nucleic acid-binding protein